MVRLREKCALVGRRTSTMRRRRRRLSWNKITEHLQGKNRLTLKNKLKKTSVANEHEIFFLQSTFFSFN